MTERMDDSGKKGAKFNLEFAKKIMVKDLKQLKANKEIFITMIIMPLLMGVLMPLLMGILAFLDPESLASEGLDPYIAFREFIINTTLKPMYLMIPGILSMMIASDSFAGEKERKTIEALLVLPVSHREIYVGKMLTALIPSLFFSTVCFFIMGLEINLLAFQLIPAGEPLFIFGDITFWLIAFILGPLLSIVNIQTGLMISSRSKDVKSASTVSGFLIIPIIGLMFAGIANPSIMSTPWIILLLSGVLAILVYLLTIVGAKVINREKLVANID